MRPHIILPLLETNHPTQDIPRMHSYTHVDVNPCSIPHFPKEKRNVHISVVPFYSCSAWPTSLHFVIQSLSDFGQCHQRPSHGREPFVVSDREEGYYLPTTPEVEPKLQDLLGVVSGDKASGPLSSYFPLTCIKNWPIVCDFLLCVQAQMSEHYCLALSDPISNTIFNSSAS